MPIDADLEWRFISEGARPGAVQMALEEIAAERVSAGGAGLVRVFRWDPSTLSLGYGQEASTVDWSFCASNGIDVTRRQTGGGGIYHDNVGDLSYSIVVPRDAVSGELLEAYHTLCEPILTFFEDIGVDASFASTSHEAIYQPACFLRDIHPAHDIVIAEKKVSGNAQYRQRDAVIQHGSIIFDNRISPHLGVFETDISSSRFTERVTSLVEHADLSREDAVEELERVLREWSHARPGVWDETELEAARQLAEDKYADDGWLRRV